MQFKKINYLTIHLIFLAVFISITELNYIIINELFTSKGIRIIIVPLIELVTVYFTCYILLKTSKKILYWLGIFFYSIYSIIVIIQCFSIYISNNYISPMAIGNAENGNLINTSSLYIMIAINLFIIGLCTFYLNNKFNERVIVNSGIATQKKKIISYMILVILYLISIIKLDKFEEASIAKNQAPLSALIQAFLNYNSSGFFIGKYLGNQESYKEFFTKKDTFTDPLPFRQVRSIKQPNVIVFFMEGVSAQLLDSYGSKYVNLTPTLDKLAENSLLVTNYYNHTAATNRGIRGNLISGYQLPDDFYSKVSSHETMQRPTLATILSKHNYQTEFFIPHPKKQTNMYIMLKSLGFDKVFYLENIAQDYFNNNITPDVTGSVGDRDLINALINNLKRKEDNENEQPFFIGIYNIGTHAFLDNKEHPYGNGKNEVLNRIHNFDYQFGKFLDYFLNSQFNQNTLLILTADHATFPDPAYRSISKAQFFIDKIPLIIHAPFIEFPKNYDAQGRNSIDFAPTVLHILNIKNERNMFLGCSLFEDCKKENFNVASMGDGFFVTDKHHLYEEKKIPKTYKDNFIRIKHKIYKYYSLDYD